MKKQIKTEMGRKATKKILNVLGYKHKETRRKLSRIWQVEIRAEAGGLSTKIKNYLKKTALATLSLLEKEQIYSSIPPYFDNISIFISSDQVIQELNKQYRKKDKSTDVLSFSQLDACPYTNTLGDIIISIETAKIQAKHAGTSLQNELLRLIIHGILHLFGYEHENVTPSKARIMRKMEIKLMEKVRK